MKVYLENNPERAAELETEDAAKAAEKAAREKANEEKQAAAEAARAAEKAAREKASEEKKAAAAEEKEVKDWLKGLIPKVVQQVEAEKKQADRLARQEAKAAKAAEEAKKRTKPAAPKQCDAPRLQDGKASETGAELILKVPFSETRISKYELEVRDVSAQQSSRAYKPVVEIVPVEHDLPEGEDFRYPLKTSLEPGKEYTVKVRAVGTEPVIQKGLVSKPLSFTTALPPLQQGKPHQPVKPLLQEQEENRIAVLLQKPESDSPIIEMEVWYRQVDGEWKEPEPVPPQDLRDSPAGKTFLFSLEDLDSSTKYEIKYRAKSDGWSDCSDSIVGMTKKKTKPNAPEKCRKLELAGDGLELESVKLQVYKPRSETQLQMFEIRYADVTLLGAGQRPEYPQKPLQLKAEKTKLWERVPADSSFDYTLEGLTPDSKYSVQVRAVGTKEAVRRKGDKSWSDPVEVQTKACVLPAQPDVPTLDGTPTDLTIRLRLCMPSSDDPIVTMELFAETEDGEDRIKWTLIDKDFENVEANDNFTFEAHDLEPAQRVRFTLRAKTKHAEGLCSDPSELMQTAEAATEEQAEEEEEDGMAEEEASDEQRLKAASRAFDSMWKAKNRNNNFKTRVIEFLFCTIEYLKHVSQAFEVVPAVRKTILFEHVLIAQHHYHHLERALEEMFEIKPDELTQSQALAASMTGGAACGAALGGGAGPVGAAFGALVGAGAGYFEWLTQDNLKEGWRLLAMAQIVQLFNSAFIDREEAASRFIEFANAIGEDSIGKDAEAIFKKIPAQVHFFFAHPSSCLGTHAFCSHADRSSIPHVCSSTSVAPR